MPHPGVVSEMQNEPQLDTWIRDGEVDAMGRGELLGLVDERVLVHIECAPDLIVCMEFVTRSPCQRLGLYSKLYRHPDSPNRAGRLPSNLEIDDGAGEVTSEATQILGLGSLALAHDEEALAWLA